MSDVLKQTLFQPLSPWIDLVPLGYETHIPEKIRKLMRFVRNNTAAYVKFTPDYFVLDLTDPERMYLLEFKSTRTPLYSANRINLIRNYASDLSLSVENIGQIELAPYDSYMRLNSIGVRAAILNYCAYYSDKLLCEFVDKIKIVHKDIVRLETVRGSRTPFANIDLRTLRSLQDFLSTEHANIDNELLRKFISSAKEQLLKTMPVLHSG